MSSSSYMTETFSEDIADEIRRLGVQVDLFWTSEQHLYTDISLKPGAKILEIGSGPGYYIQKLSEIYTDAKFTSLEYDETFANYQKQLFADDSMPDVEVVHGDINGIENLGEFDLVVSRLVLEHLPDPEVVFNKMSRFVKEGGIFLLIDNDFSNHLRTYPRVDELDDLYDAYCNMREKEGGNPYIGRELPRFFTSAKYGDVGFKTITVHTYNVDKSLFLGAESSAIGRTLVKEGYLASEVFDNLIVNWSVMAHDPRNAMTRELYCAYGTKTPATTDIKTEDAATTGVKALEKKKPVFSQGANSSSAPDSEVEKNLAEIWCSLLNISEVGKDTSFFDLGGESYMVPLVVKQVSDIFGVDITMTDIFEHPTITSLAKIIKPQGQDNALEKSVSGASKQKQALAGKKDKNPFARLRKK